MGPVQIQSIVVGGKAKNVYNFMLWNLDSIGADR